MTEATSDDGLGAYLSAQPLLALTIVAILVAVSAGMLASQRPALADWLRKGAYAGMALAGLLTVAHLITTNRTSRAAMMFDRARPAGIEGNETVIAKRGDGHFWVRARLNGVPVDFLVDTGATYTAVSGSVAARAGLFDESEETHEGRVLDTANGPVVVAMARAASLSFGAIDARGIELAVLPDSADEAGDAEDAGTNVIGMNLLSGLSAWRVEGDRLILTP